MSYGLGVPERLWASNTSTLKEQTVLVFSKTEKNDPKDQRADFMQAMCKKGAPPVDFCFSFQDREIVV